MKEVFENHLQDVRYKDWDFNVQMDGARAYLQVEFRAQDMRYRHGEKECQKGRKWLLSPYMTKSEVVQTAFKAVLTAEEHEARENFTYKDAAIFGPHFHVDVLAVACHEGLQDARQQQERVA